MKVLLQRVARAAVRVEGAVVGSIGAGVLVFLAVETADTNADAEYLADKTADLRIFPDGEGKMNLGLVDVGGQALVVSQFTLAGTTRRGRRPSFSGAAPPDDAKRLYEVFAGRLAARGVTVQRGTFRASMEVELVNDGPVTILLDPRPAPGEP